MRSNRFVLIAFLAATFASAVTAQSGGNYIIKDATLEGTAHEATGDNIAVQARAGQWLAGPALTGGNFSVGGGFFPAPPQPSSVLTPPAAPINLVVATIFRDRVDLSWEDNSQNEAGFVIERCNGNGRCTKWGLLPSTGPDVTTYSDPTVMSGTVYQYRVSAFNAAGNSAYSNTVVAKIPRK